MDRTRVSLLFASLVLAATFGGCATQKTTAADTRREPLRVGVSPTSPPFVSRQGSGVAGLEVDFARELATALGRPLEMREFEWDELIPALEANQIDIIMSGMTITRARQVRIAFSDPYLRSGLIALVRSGESRRYPTGKSVLATNGSIGVVANTTGERFTREHAQSVSVYPTVRAAVDELRQRRVDAVIHDAPILLTFAAANEAELAPVLQLLDDEPLGWGMRRSDTELISSVNATLARWRTDGTRERILSRWIPYWARLESAAPAL